MRVILHQSIRCPTVSDHFVYIVECADQTLYTGYTTAPERRVEEHNAGDGAKYTRGRTPVELVYLEECASRSAALSREHEIKSLTREEKEQLASRQSRGELHSFE